MTLPGTIRASGRRTCSSCHEEKSLAEFYRSSTHSTGHQTSCKDCQKGRVRLRERGRRRVRVSTPRMRQQWLAASQRYLKTERGRMIHREQVRRYRARLREADVRVVLQRDLRRLLHRYGGKCFYCKVEPATTWDHVIPLARGGRHSIGNLVPACSGCNTSKHARLLVVWRRTSPLRRAA